MPVLEYHDQPIDATENIVYCNLNGRELKLDLYRPITMKGPYPVVMRMSGGGWRTGGKPGSFGRLRWLFPEGIAVAGVEYRPSHEALWPAQGDDCVAAIRYLADHAQELNLDANRIGLIGDSAGGHVIAMGAVMAARLQAEGALGGHPAAVCAITTPADLTTLTGESLEPLAALLGGPLENNLGKARAASPLYNVNASLPPHLILHGADDKGVPADSSRQWHTALVEAGVLAELVMYPGIGHATDPFYEPVVSASRITAFFRRYLCDR